MKLSTFSDWLSAHARRDVDRVRFALAEVGKHPYRGAVRSTDAQTRQVPENDHKLREARIAHVPGTREEFYVYLVEGQCEDRLTMTRASIGQQTSEEGLYRALREILRDPPGWPRIG